MINKKIKKSMNPITLSIKHKKKCVLIKNNKFRNKCMYNLTSFFFFNKNNNKILLNRKLNKTIINYLLKKKKWY